MTSLIDTVLSYLSPAVTSAAANQLGESESAITKAMKGIAASIFAGMIGKSNDASAWGNLFHSLSDSKNAGFLNNITSLITGGNLAHNDPKDISGKLIGALFGDKTANLLNSVSQFGNLKPGSASALLGLAGPIVMGVLGKKIASDNLNADGLKRLLWSQADDIRAAAPAGVSDMFGLGKLADLAKPVERVATAATSHIGAATTAAASTAAAAKAGMPAWLWAIPAVLGLGLVGWLLTRGDRTKVEATAPTETVVASAPVEPTPVAVEPAAPVEAPIIASIEPSVTEFTRDFGGFLLRGAPQGVEAKLIAFIESGQAPCTDPQCWFTFDRLTFESGSARLDMAKSQEQITNIAEVLKAFPGIQLKIGGYTDNTGSNETNMKLSQERAQAVVDAVAALGIAPTRLVAEGYGPQFPIADNATEEGRAQNRRIDVRVRERG
jgi:outer membrane protein OmpA-like peptidoglycan-associated protein